MTIEDRVRRQDCPTELMQKHVQRKFDELELPETIEDDDTYDLIVEWARYFDSESRAWDGEYMSLAMCEHPEAVYPGCQYTFARLYDAKARELWNRAETADRRRN